MFDKVYISVEVASDGTWRWKYCTASEGRCVHHCAASESSRVRAASYVSDGTMYVPLSPEMCIRAGP